MNVYTDSGSRFQVQCSMRWLLVILWLLTAIVFDAGIHREPRIEEYPEGDIDHILLSLNPIRSS
jgi:hypothetical protein